MIGNSRLHWARFVDHQLQATWDTPHVDLTVSTPGNFQNIIYQAVDSQHNLGWGNLGDAVADLWIGSAVPEQSQFWQSYPRVHFLQLAQVPLQGMYSTLGIDRALAVWGAIASLGSPVLVIDAGTALTFTGADQSHQLVGGAILPGLRLQLRSLNQETAALPFVQLLTGAAPPEDLPVQLPTRWSLNTPEAITSGVIHTLIAGIQSFIEDWWQRFPNSNIVMTGGDSHFLHQCFKQHGLKQHGLKQQCPEIADRIVIDPHLIFRGMAAIVP